MTMIPPDPPMVPRALRPSRSVDVSSIEAGRTLADEPPGQNTLIVRPGLGPPASSSMMWRQVEPGPGRHGGFCFEKKTGLVADTGTGSGQPAQRADCRPSPGAAAIPRCQP